MVCQEVCQEVSAEVFHVCSAEDSAEEICSEDSKKTLPKMSAGVSDKQVLNRIFLGKVEMRCLVSIRFLILH